MKVASPGLIAVVREDLHYLIASWPRGDVGDDEIRRSSSVLRRLFTYRDLIKVWITVVGTRDFLVPSSFIEISDIGRLHEVDFATSSSARSIGMKVFSAVAYNTIQEAAPPIRVQDEEAPLKRYLNQPACIISGTPITRDELIQFVANKMGGTHYDEGRQKPQEQAIEAMSGYMVGNRPALIHEMLSYGQILAASTSAKELLSALEK